MWQVLSIIGLIALAVCVHDVFYLCAAGVRVDVVVIDPSSVHDHAVDSAR